MAGTQVAAPSAKGAAEQPKEDAGKRARHLFQQATQAYDKTDFWEAIQFCREAIELVNDEAEYLLPLGSGIGP